jgi:putative membrane protein insertion efficiency factor
MDADTSAPSLSAGQRLLLALLTGYKGLISPFFAGTCRFVPSCSEFARGAIVEHGVLKGAWLAARRIGRCHPWGSYGVDPVPGRTVARPPRDLRR